MLEQRDFEIRYDRKSHLFGVVVISLYLSAIVLANYLITRYGQIALPLVAFALIPFDLVARDLMQDRWQGHKMLRWRMVVLITTGGFISAMTGTGSIRVNFASWLAFLVAGLIDALTYQKMIKYGRIFRINGATIIAAITDSIIFVTIAFSSINWKLVGLQIGMKVVGGFVWSLMLYRLFKKRIPQPEITWIIEECGCLTENGVKALCSAHGGPPATLWGIPVYVSDRVPNPPGIILTDKLTLRDTFPEVIISEPPIPPLILRPNQQLRVRVGYPRMQDYANDTPWVGFWLSEKLGTKTYSCSYFLLPPIEDVAILEYTLGRMDQELQRIIDREHYTISPSEADLTIP